MLGRKSAVKALQSAIDNTRLGSGLTTTVYEFRLVQRADEKTALETSFRYSVEGVRRVYRVHFGVRVEGWGSRLKIGGKDSGCF